MRKPEQNQQNQQRCTKCGKIVGCDCSGKPHGCDCEPVRCTNCNWQGTEDRLALFDDANGGGYGCPNCKTDHYLSEVVI